MDGWVSPVKFKFDVHLTSPHLFCSCGVVYVNRGQSTTSFIKSKSAYRVLYFEQLLSWVFPLLLMEGHKLLDMFIGRDSCARSRWIENVVPEIISPIARSRDGTTRFPNYMISGMIMIKSRHSFSSKSSHGEISIRFISIRDFISLLALRLFLSPTKTTQKLDEVVTLTND